MGLWAKLFGKAEQGKAPEGVTNAYKGPPIRDLQQEDVIAELQKMGMSFRESDEAVQAALVLIGVLDRAQIEAIHFAKDRLTRDNLAQKWAAHCAYHGGQFFRL